MYRKGIRNPLIVLPYVAEDREESHVWHLFIVRTKERARLQAHLLQAGIMTSIHYPIPPHKQRAYSELAALDLPISEQLHEEVLSLPIGPCLTDEEAERVIAAVNQYAE